MSDTPTTLLRIRRGTPGEDAGWSEFPIAYIDGASVLDGLMQVRAQHDATLAIRYSCISANVCKECMIRIDGRTEYACTARLHPGTMVLEPLPTKRWIRDLVTDIVPPKERLDEPAG